MTFGAAAEPERGGEHLVAQAAEQTAHPNCGPRRRPGFTALLWRGPFLASKRGSILASAEAGPDSRPSGTPCAKPFEMRIPAKMNARSGDRERRFRSS
jgi:hypothetical protein